MLAKGQGFGDEETTYGVGDHDGKDCIESSQRLRSGFQPSLIPGLSA